MAASPPASLQLAPHRRGAQAQACLRRGARLGKVPSALQVRTWRGGAVHPRPVVEGMHGSFPVLVFLDGRRALTHPSWLRD